jgi:hypothetical protein
MQLIYDKGFRKTALDTTVAPWIKRSRAEQLVITLKDSLALFTLPTGASLRFKLKPKGLRDTTPLVTVTLTSADLDAQSGTYRKTFVTINAAVNAALGIDNTSTNDIASLICEGELAYIPGAGQEPQLGDTFEITLLNSVDHEEDQTPASLASPDDFVAARSVLYDRAQSLTSPQKTQALANLGLIAGSAFDEILEYPAVAALPATGEVGKIYVIIAGADINKTYRWTGSVYALISGGGGSFAIASQAEAEAGTENTKGMTSLRTKQAITSQRPQPVIIVFSDPGLTEEFSPVTLPHDSTVLLTAQALEMISGVPGTDGLVTVFLGTINSIGVATEDDRELRDASGNVLLTFDTGDDVLAGLNSSVTVNGSTGSWQVVSIGPDYALQYNFGPTSATPTVSISGTEVRPADYDLTSGSDGTSDTYPAFSFPAVSFPAGHQVHVLVRGISSPTLSYITIPDPDGSTTNPTEQEFTLVFGADSKAYVVPLKWASSAALDAKASVTALTDGLALKANIASPTFTGLMSGVRLALTAGTVTASTPVLSATQTWNNAAVTFVARRLAINNTASNFGISTESLFDEWLGGSAGTTRLACIGSNGGFGSAVGFSVSTSPAGSGSWSGLGPGGGGVSIINGGTKDITCSVLGYGTQFNSVRSLGFATELSGYSQSHVKLWGDVANVLRLSVGTNPQALQIDGTFTDASNYERLRLITAAGDYEIGTAAAGTGTRRNLKLNGANRSVYIAAPTNAEIRDILISHGLMAAS